MKISNNSKNEPQYNFKELTLYIKPDIHPLAYLLFSLRVPRQISSEVSAVSTGSQFWGKSACSIIT